MSAHINYEIKEFIIESLDGSKSIDATTCVARLDYKEDLFSANTIITMQIVNTDGLISSLPIRGGERVRLKIYQPATDSWIEIEETKNPHYIYKLYGSTSQSTREMFLIEIAPVELYKNETSRVFKRYPEKQGKEQKINISVKNILMDRNILNVSESRIFVDETKNTYSFYGNSKKPFDVINWLRPKCIPQVNKSSPESGTAGFLFYRNKNGFYFKSLDGLFAQSPVATYSYYENVGDPADPSTNFFILNVPTFSNNVDVWENLITGMYSSVSYFFDLNTKKFDSFKYKLSDSYNIMSHASTSNDPPKIPEGLENSPSKLMVKFIDSIVRSPLDVKPTTRQDDRIRYQASSVTRYRLAFSQTLNITIPLNLNLSVGDVIELNIGVITKSGKKEKDIKKSGLYLISQLTHDFSTNRGLTGLQLTRDSYGNK